MKKILLICSCLFSILAFTNIYADDCANLQGNWFGYEQYVFYGITFRFDLTAVIYYNSQAHNVFIQLQQGTEKWAYNGSCNNSQLKLSTGNATASGAIQGTVIKLNGKFTEGQVAGVPIIMALYKYSTE